MGSAVTNIEKGHRGDHVPVSTETITRAIVENLDGARFRNDEDTNDHFVTAAGRSATRGHQVLKEARPIQSDELDLQSPDNLIGLWSFPNITSARAAYDMLTGVTLGGTVWFLEAKREALEDAA